MAESRRDVVIIGTLAFEPGRPAREVDVVVEGGRIRSVSPRAWDESSPAAKAVRARTWVIDGRGSFLAPGFIDMHAHLREPGEEHKETIASGAAAGAAGGFTTLVAMANTRPAVDSVETLRFVQERAQLAAVRVLPVAAVTRGLEGRELTDMEALADAGAVAFSDDGRNAYDADLASQALRRAARLDRPLLVHAQDHETCADGQVDASVAAVAGLAPWPCGAEVIAAQRVIDAGRGTGGRVHLQHVSCAAAVDLVRKAKRAGLPVTAEVTPHHLALTADRVITGAAEGLPVADPMAKVNPPLRSEADREALVEALADGTIDAIATDHAPHDAASKAGDFAKASFGFSGLETALSMLLGLVDSHQLSLARVVEALTAGPARCLGSAAGVPTPGLRRGETADLVLFETRGIWTVEPELFLSRGRNTPLAGQEVRGRVLLTIASGRPVVTRWFAGEA
ncbi:MAG: dihydroorotase [Chloroflexota bacterium]|nr:dihydroorotase [Chloroflexota bacterium]